MPRLLPVYDVTRNLLYLRHYSGQKGALVNVIVVSKILMKSGRDWLVKKVEMLRTAHRA